MNNRTSIAQQIVRLLWDEKPDEARTVIAAEQARLNKEIAELRGQLADVGALLPTENAGNESHIITPPIITQMTGARPSLSTPGETDARRRKVIDTAMEIVKRMGAQITVAAVAEALQAKGYDLGVQEKRINTAIAGILFRSGPFKRVVRGVFEYVGPELFSTKDDARKEAASPARTGEAAR